MRRQTFVDTSGFYSILVAKDDAHPRAGRYLKLARDRKATFVTTDYVLAITSELISEGRRSGGRVTGSCARG